MKVATDAAWNENALTQKKGNHKGCPYGGLAGGIFVAIGCDDTVFSTDRAFWIPAFAGMTEVMREFP